MMNTVRWFVVAFVALGISSARASNHLVVEGRLEDKNGVANGPNGVRFSLFAGATGGSALWTEEHATVPFAAGYFQARLGETTPLDAALFATHPALWLQTAIKPDGAVSFIDFGARIPLETDPYAFRALSAAVADDASSVAGFKPAPTPAANGLLVLDANGKVPMSAVEDGAIGLVKLSGFGCAQGNAAKWTGSVWACGNDDGTTYTGSAGVVVSGTLITLDAVLVGNLAKAAAFDTPLELAAAVPGWDQDAGDDLTLGTLFSGAVTGSSNAMALSAGAVAFVHWATNNCTAGEIPKYGPSGWACGADETLSEADIDAFVANNGYALEASLATVAKTGQFTDLVGIPPDIGNGDDDSLAALSCQNGEIVERVSGQWACGADTVLTEAEVDAYVANNGYALAESLASVAKTGQFTDLVGIPPDIGNGDDDSLAALSCQNGEIVERVSGQWACAADTSLTEAEVDAYVANNGFALNGSAASDLACSGCVEESELAPEVVARLVDPAAITVLAQAAAYDTPAELQTALSGWDQDSTDDLTTSTVFGGEFTGTWDSLTLATIVPVSKGGTGASSLAAGGVVLGNGASPVTVVSPGPSGHVLTSDGTTWVSQPSGGASSIFGDGSDGDVTLSGNTVLTRDMYYKSLTIAPLAALFPNGYRIFVSGTLTNQGTVARNGNAGNPGSDGQGARSGQGTSSNPGGSGGGGLAAGTLSGTVAGAPGGTGGGGGGNGGSGSSGGGGGTGPSVSSTIGGNGSSGGSGGNGGGGSGGGGGGGSGGGGPGTGSRAGMQPRDVHSAVLMLDFSTGTIVKLNNSGGSGGGAGGGGGGGFTTGCPCCGQWIYGGSGGGGGGSGSSGGVVLIVARAIVNTGTIEALGAPGGKGGNGGVGSGYNGSCSGGASGAGGGGGGAPGGSIILVTSSLTGGGTLSVAGGAGGKGGDGASNGGNGSTQTPGGPGTDGAAGPTGTVIVLQP